MTCSPGGLLHRLCVETAGSLALGSPPGLGLIFQRSSRPLNSTSYPFKGQMRQFMTRWSDLLCNRSQKLSPDDSFVKCSNSGCIQARGSQRHGSCRVLALLAGRRGLREAAEEQPSVPSWGIWSNPLSKGAPGVPGLAGAAGTLLWQGAAWGEAVCLHEGSRTLPWAGPGDVSVQISLNTWYLQANCSLCRRWLQWL